MDKQVVYELILSHGRTEVFLHYAMVIGDYQRVIEHWVLEEDWEKAIESLSRQVRHSIVFKSSADPHLLVQS